MTRRQSKKEVYYHVYQKNTPASKSRIVMRVSNSKTLECLIKGLSNESIIKSCGLYLDNGKLKSNLDYVAVEISPSRAARKIEASKYDSFSMQNWND